MKSIPPALLAAWAALSVGVAGCSVLQPKADLSRFYVLRAQPVAPAAVRALSGATEVRVGPGRLAGYLDNSRIVLQQGPNQIEYLDLSRWGEPLPKGLARVLGENLAARLNHAQIIVYPDPTLVAAGYEVHYTVERFEGGLKDAVSLKVAWQVVERPGNTVLVDKRSLYTVPVGTGVHDVAAYVERMSVAVARWADEVAAAIPSD